MSNDVSIELKVDARLRSRFVAAAAAAQRRPERVLQELMQGYVAKVQGVPDAGDSIPDAERRSRQEAVDFARANIGLEGLSVSADEEARAQRFIDGEIELDEFVAPPNERPRTR